MKKLFLLIVSLFLLTAIYPQVNAQQKVKEKKYHAWWDDQNVGKPLNSPNSQKLPLISVSGNKFVDERGKTILFRGLSISDPDKIENQDHWNKEYFVKVKEMGTMLVRIPIHPIAWRERTPEKYLELLDQAVEWCTELGMYIIIDWHSIGNLRMEIYQDPMYYTTKSETYEFWRIMAKHFKGHNTVAFFELFNEPTLFNGELGTMSWSEWKKINEDMITLIRAFDTKKIPLVAGFDWAYDLTPLLIEPISAENIGYVTHPYPHKRSKPYEPKWEENFGFASSKYPIVASEIGFTMGKEGMDDNGDYGKAVINYLEAKGISWVAWVFDPQWFPKMFDSWDNYKLTACGEFFKNAMLKENNKQ